MPGVGGRKALPKENVAQMAAAAGALDLYSLTVRIRKSFDGPGYLLIERRPAATSVELIQGSIQFGVAPPADISAFLIKVIVLSGKRPLRTLSFNHVPLLRRKRIVL